MERVSDIETIQLDLYENGMDSYKLGIDAFIKGDENPLYYKLAIKELFSAFELILKELLSQEHSSLIYVDVEDMGKPIEKRKTVDFSRLMSRLENIAGIEFKQSYLNKIKKLQKQRNIIQHYKIKINKHYAADLISTSIPIMMYILNEFFYKETNLLDEIGDNYFSKLMLIEKSFKEIEKIALEQFKEKDAVKLKKLYKDIYCPVCNSEIIGYIDEDVKCFCCNNTFDIEDFLDYYAKIMDEIDYDSISSCPKCYLKTMYHDESQDIYICLKCYHEESIESCEYCSDNLPISELNDITNYYNEMSPDRYEYICDSCYHDIEGDEFPY